MKKETRWLGDNWSTWFGTLTKSVASCCVLLFASRVDAASIKPVLLEGDAPRGAKGQAIKSFKSLSVNGLGQLAVSMAVGPDAAFWLDGKLVFIGGASSRPSFTQDGAGVSDAGAWLAMASQTIWTSGTELVRVGNTAPNFSPAGIIKNISQGSMTANGEIHFVAWIDANSDGVGEQKVLYRVPGLVFQDAQVIARTGDEISGAGLLGEDAVRSYSVSLNGQHSLIHGNIGSNTQVVILDGKLALKQRASTGVEGVWKSFALPVVNNGGHYLAAALTTAQELRDNAIVYDGEIAIRENESIGDFKLQNPAVPKQLALNNRGQAVHFWQLLQPSGALLLSCDAAAMRETTQVLLKTGQEIDWDDDGLPDASVEAMQWRTTEPPVLHITDEESIYLFARLRLATGEILESVLQVNFACCGDGKIGPGEDCDDGNQIQDETCPATCKFESTGGSGGGGGQGGNSGASGTAGVSGMAGVSGVYGAGAGGDAALGASGGEAGQGVAAGGVGGEGSAGTSGAASDAGDRSGASAGGSPDGTPSIPKGGGASSVAGFAGEGGVVTSLPQTATPEDSGCSACRLGSQSQRPLSGLALCVLALLGLRRRLRLSGP